MSENQKISIGVDIGGTHTDLLAVLGDRSIRSKALTTHNDYSEGIFNALRGAAGQLGIALQDLLTNQCNVFVNGSTIVTNALTELKGAKVGVLVTAGFADILRLGRGSRTLERDDHKQLNLPSLVSQDLICEINERIDRDGKVLVPLSQSDIEMAVRNLLANGAECIAVCFMWSTANNKHEQEAEQIILRCAPGTFVTRSQALVSVFREHERWQTAILNCYVHPQVKKFIKSVAVNLKDWGYHGQPEFFNGLGGVLTENAVAKAPVELYSSGPAGGATASAALAARYGFKKVLIGDMGGTSFDTTLIEDYKPKVAQRCAIGRFDTALSLLDIDSIGAGGGSIVHLDSRRVPQVGPQSAGSIPGPVCWGRGGTQPTLTDCMVVMGLLGSENYLGGEYRLDVEASRAALEREVGNALGWDALKTASGAYQLAVANMGGALREKSIRRGRDPRDCVFIAYGGALPMFSASICRHLGISDMLIPDNSSAFSAYGLLMADYVTRKSATLGWVVGEEHGYRLMIETRDLLEQQVRTDLRHAGFAEGKTQITFGGDFRYSGQLSELHMPFEKNALGDLGASIIPVFNDVYEKEFGPDTAWRDSKLMLVNFVVVGIGIRDKPDQKEIPIKPSDPAKAIMSQRRVFLPDEREWDEIPVFDAAKLLPGAEVAGPAIVDCRDTTIYLPRSASLRRDELNNFRVTV